MPGRREFQKGDRVRLGRSLGTVTGDVKLTVGNVPAATIEFDGAATWYTVAVAYLERMPTAGFYLYVDVDLVADYIDYERNIPGFGEDGTDRLERATFAKRQSGKNDRNSWYAIAIHRDLGGNDWYEETSGDNLPSREAAVQWLEEDRAKAPKKKEDISG